MGYTAEGYVLRQSRKPIAGSDWKYNFHFLCSSYNFKVSDKAEEERTCTVVSGKKCHKRTYLGMTREEDTRTGFQIKRFC